MKNFTFLSICILITSLIHAQSLPERIAMKACEKLDTLNSLKQIEDSLQNVLTKAMLEVLVESDKEEKKVIGTVEGIRNTIKESKELIPSVCQNVRRLIINEKLDNYYKMSNSDDANIHYTKGNELMNNGDYKQAIKEFKSAIKFDNEFIYAIDHLAISYRNLNKFKTAIKHYLNSLEIFPEGHLALLNIAVSYTFIEDYDNALKYYNELAFLYPDNPEGYFGLAKILLIKTDYEKSLDNAFTAHLIYTETNSDYIKDSEQLIGIIYSELQKKDKLELFERKAKEYNVEIEIN